MARIIFVGREGDIISEGGTKYKANVDVCEVSDARAKGLVNSKVAKWESDAEKEKNCVTPKEEARKRSDVIAKSFRLSLPPVPDASPLWVVVATCERPKDAIRQAELILAQGPDMLVVSNDGCDDPEYTDEKSDVPIVNKLPVARALTYIRRGERGGPNAARHDAILLAPDDAIIVEVDDHDYIEEGALRAVRAAFVDKSVWAVYGDHYRLNSARNRFARHGFVEKGEYYAGAFMELGALHTGLRAYRKALYTAVGGYRMSETPAGDLGLFLRFEVGLGGQGIKHLARPLCSVVISMEGISVARREEQSAVARRLKSLAVSGLLFASDKEITAMGDPAAAYEKTPENDSSSFTDVKDEVLREFEDDAKDAEVIAVVPTYNTSKHLFHTLDCLKDAGIPVVVVDDACPQDSGMIAAKHSHSDVKVVKLSRNCGFGRAVNVGAKYALSRNPQSILMLNADAFPRDGAIEAMIGRMNGAKKLGTKLGIIGNTHITSRPPYGMQSQGSEWSWEGKQYKHVGRGIDDPIPGEAPKPRDMVTFACCLIRTEVWKDLNGLDEKFKEAYWEDADFCLRAREAGWDIMWSGGPETEHVCGASHARKTSYEDNAKLFRNRWMESGKVDKYARARGVNMHGGPVVGCMIACNEEEFIGPSLQSVYPLVDKLVVVVGGTTAGKAAGLCGPDGFPLDGTVEALEKFDDPDKKLEIVLPDGRPWGHKRDMREEYASRLKDGDWMLLLDGDEVFSDEGLWRMSRHMHMADVIMPGFWLVWNRLDTIGTGKWDAYPQYKAIRWRNGYNYKKDDNIPCDADGRPLSTIPRLKVIRTPKEHLYVHYSWVRPLEKIKQKLEYYRHKPNMHTRPSVDYFEKVFMGWREDHKRVESEFGTHPFGGGRTAKLPCAHPAPVLERIKDGSIGGVGW